jgi:flagellar basal-body rod protein FlgC
MEGVMSIDLYSSVAGINAFFRKMDVAANNVANINTDNYKRRIAHISQDKNGLPETKITIDNTPGLENPRKPGEPEGPPREMSNVNYAEEAVSMIEAKIGVKANVKALQISGEMFGSLVDFFA